MNTKNSKTIAYVYKWYHLPSLKWYVGSRAKKGCHPNDGYICSSKHVKPMIENNPNDWVRLILDVGSPQEMRDLEAEILVLFDAKNDIRSFNMHNGDGKFTTLGRKASEETRAKISAALKGVPLSQEHKAKLSIVGRGRIVSEETKARQSAALRGRKLSQEHIDKNRAAKTGVKQSPESVAKRTKVVIATNMVSGETFELKGHIEIKSAGFSTGNVSLCANGKQSCHKGHTFSFKERDTPAQ